MKDSNTDVYQKSCWEIASVTLLSIHFSQPVYSYTGEKGLVKETVAIPILSE